MRVAAFTGSATISSRRFRVLQYMDILAAHGIQVDEFISRFGSWPPPERWKRASWLVSTVIDRIAPTLQSRSYDLTLLQRELVSTLCTLEPFTGRPRVLDVDDAVWLNGPRAHRNFARIARSCDGVVCGNTYIAEHVSAWNSNITVLPTAVDTDRFSVAQGRGTREKRIIGWSGLHSGAKYLLAVESALHRVLLARRGTILRIVSDACPNFRLLRQEMVEFIRWSPANEVETIQDMDVGLMPIDDTQWSRGKCSYKMLLYMSCGIPVVVSPVGMNNEVLGAGDVGFGANTADQWADCIIALIDNESERQRLGAAARSVVESRYSLKIIGPRLANYLLGFGSH